MQGINIITSSIREGDSSSGKFPFIGDPTTPSATTNPAVNNKQGSPKVSKKPKKQTSRSNLPPGNKKATLRIPKPKPIKKSPVPNNAQKAAARRLRSRSVAQRSASSFQNSRPLISNNKSESKTRITEESRGKPKMQPFKVYERKQKRKIGERIKNMKVMRIKRKSRDVNASNKSKSSSKLITFQKSSQPPTSQKFPKN